MSEQTSITQRASEYVFELFKEKLPQHILYHNYAHTQSVAETARKLAKGLELSDDAIEIVTVAAWLHDTGFTEQYSANEDFGKRIAQEFLKSENYPEDKIEFVLGCIEATKMPQHPTNLLQEILCDADLSYLGKKTFSDRSNLLRIEWEKMLGKVLTDKDWLRGDLDFLTSHTFFTCYAQELFDEQKSKNIHARDKQLRSLLNDDGGTKGQEDISFTKTSAQHTHDSSQDSIDVAQYKVSGIEILLLTGQVDSKAGMMLLVNSVILALLSTCFIADGEITFGVIGMVICMLLSVSLALSVAVLMYGLNKSIIPNGTVIRKKNSCLRLSYIFFMSAVAVSVFHFILASIYDRGWGGV